MKSHLLFVGLLLLVLVLVDVMKFAFLIEVCQNLSKTFIVVSFYLEGTSFPSSVFPHTVSVTHQSSAYLFLSVAENCSSCLLVKMICFCARRL